MTGLSFTVASWADRDDLVIELTTGDGDKAEEWGLVTYDPSEGKPVIELYPRMSGGEWNFDLDELNAILEKARERILYVAGPEAREAMLAAQTEMQVAPVS